MQKKETFLPTLPSLHNTNVNEWMNFVCLLKKNEIKYHISADNKHEKFQMKDFFFF